MELFVGNAFAGTEDLQVQLRAAVEAKDFRLAVKIQDKVNARKDPTFPSPWPRISLDRAPPRVLSAFIAFANGSTPEDATRCVS